MAGELIRYGRRLQSVSNHVATARINFAIKAQRYRLTSDGTLQIAVGGNDALDVHVLHPPRA